MAVIAIGNRKERLSCRNFRALTSRTFLPNHIPHGLRLHPIGSSLGDIITSNIFSSASHPHFFIIDIDLMRFIK